MIGIKASSIQPSCNYPVYVASAEAYATSGTDCVINKPTGTVQGDVMVAVINFNSNITVTAPSGWTTIDEDDGIPSAGTALIYYKVAGASEPTTYTWQGSASNRYGGVIATFTGSFNSDPSNGTFSYAISATTSTTNVTANAMTLTSGCAMVVYLGAYDQVAGNVWTKPSGWTDACLNNGTNNAYIGYKTFANSGSTGTVAYTINSANAYKVMWLWSFVTNT
jgi:hypothetical protein